MQKQISLLIALLFSLTVISYAQVSENTVQGARPGYVPNIKDNSGSYIPQELTVIYEDNFNADNTVTGITARGWIFMDIDGAGSTTTFQGNTTVFSSYEGTFITAGDGYLGENFNGAFGGGLLIDQWLISPQFTVAAGDTLSYWWRGAGGGFDDSVYVLISDGGSTIPDFTLNLGRFRVPDQGAWVNFHYNFATAGTKRVALRYYHTNGGPGGTYSNYWGLDLFQIISGAPPTGPGPATNPNPANAATNVDIDANLSWTNPAGATSLAVYFGTNPGSLSSIYSGAPVTTRDPGTMVYSTTYYWRIDETDGTGTTTGPVWSFTTESDPNIVTAFFDDFEANIDTVPSGWVVTNDGGTLVWRVFGTPYPNAYTLPCGVGCGKVLSADADEGSTGGTTLLSTARINQTFNATQYQTVTLEFDNDVNNIDADDFAYVEVSNNGGSTWNIAWQFGGSTADLRNTHEVVNISTWAALNNFMVRFRSVQPGWDWWWAVDNVAIYFSNLVPVELTSFTVSVVGGNVNLNWSTATETNNYGFDVERKSDGQEFAKVGFVAGYGTTTEAKSYNFVDNGVTSGNYTYRLKQVDLNGQFEYSNMIEVVVAPKSYSLDQNYPNPFNPSTKIDFTLAADSKVTLKIFDVLGQEVVTLINGNLAAQSHSIEFDASSLNSGVYFYTIEAVGIDGTNFQSTKKMMLTK